MRHTFSSLALAIALCAPVLAHAHGNFKCTEPTAEWQYKEALEEKLKKEGWKIKRIKVDNGCYEVYGFDAKGRRAETYFNPRTLEKLGDVFEQQEGK